MKKHIFLFITIFSMIALTGCTKEELPSDGITTYEPSINEEINPSSPKEETYSFEHNDIHFTHSPSENIQVTITYPQFKDAKLATLNTQIEDFSKSKFKNIMNNLSEDSTSITLEENYTITLANTNLISIMSKGTLSVSKMPYSSATNNVLNINPTTLEEYETTHILNISDDFIALFRTQSASLEDFANYLATISDDELKMQMKDAKIYFTDTTAIILFSVPHAIGDFVEISFDKETILPHLIISY